MRASAPAHPGGSKVHIYIKSHCCANVSGSQCLAPILGMFHVWPAGNLCSRISGGIRPFERVGLINTARAPHPSLAMPHAASALGIIVNGQFIAPGLVLQVCGDHHGQLPAQLPARLQPAQPARPTASSASPAARLAFIPARKATASAHQPHQKSRPTAHTP